MRLNTSEVSAGSGDGKSLLAGPQRPMLVERSPTPSPPVFSEPRKPYSSSRSFASTV